MVKVKALGVAFGQMELWMHGKTEDGGRRKEGTWW